MSYINSLQPLLNYKENCSNEFSKTENEPS